MAVMDFRTSIIALDLPTVLPPAAFRAPDKELVHSGDIHF
jgi:hypothetical protein